jgi:hypothetical protein
MLSQRPLTHLHHRFIIFVRLGVNPSTLLECLHLEALGVRVSLWDSLITLGGCCHLDGLEQRGSSSRGWWLSLVLIVVIVRGSWPFPSGEPKGTLVNCSWLVWSSSCVGCVAPYWGFGVWCQLAREPPSEWITATRTSFPASKWTSVKNHCVIIWLWGDWSSLVFILVIDWFTPWLGGITILLTLSILPQTSCQAL